MSDTMISVEKLVTIMSDAQMFLNLTLGHINIVPHDKYVTLIPPYSCIQHDDEEMCLIWIGNAKIRMDIGFNGTGEYSYWAQDMTTKEEFTGDNVFIYTMLPAKVLELLIEEI